MASMREVYRRTGDGSMQSAASKGRWYLYEDYVHLAPHHQEGRLFKIQAELEPL